MATDATNRSQLFINRVDEQTRENILKLDQKLRIMRAEVESKLTSIAFDKGSDSASYKSGLLQVEQEINSAIQGINNVVNMMVDSEQPDQSILNGQSMAEFSQMIAENLENVSKLKNLS